MNALPRRTLLALSLSLALSEVVLADQTSSPTNSLLDKTAFAKEFVVAFTNYTWTSRLQDFPVLIRLSTAIDGFSYADFHLPNGGDVRFADSSGNLLSHEIDTWDTNGVSTVWVKVPLFSTRTRISILYGCDDPPQVNAADVWSNGYVGVWHLGESSVPMMDSSGVSTNFTQATGSSLVYAEEGVVGRAVNFARPSCANSLVAPDHDALDGFEKCTVEMWTRQTEHVTNGGVLSKRRGYKQDTAYYLYDTGSSLSFTVSSNGVSTATVGSVKPDLDVWSHIAFSFDSTADSLNAKRYLNGGDVSSTVSCGTITNSPANLCLGSSNAGATANFVGRFDELRISRTARSADWIKVTYECVAKEDFATFALPGEIGDDEAEVFGDPYLVEGIGKSSALAIDGNTLYCGSGGTLHLLDISDPLDPRPVSSLAGFSQLRQIDVENGLVAISSRGGGAWLVDVSDRTAPRILSHIDTVEQATGMVIAGNFMAIGQRTTGVELFDITDRTFPQHICLVKTQESQSCRYKDGILYSGDWHSGKVNLIDVTDISKAKIIGAATLKGYGDGFDIDGDYIYASTGHHRINTNDSNVNTNGNGIEIWDCSNPSNVTFVSRVEFPTFFRQGTDWWTCRESDGWVFCSDVQNGVFAVAATNPANAHVADRFVDPNPSDPEAPSHCINYIAVGNGAVYAVDNNGLWVIPCRFAKFRAQNRGTELTQGNLAWREAYETPDTSHFRAWHPPARGQVHSAAAYGDYYYAGCSYAGAYVIDARTLHTVRRIPCAYARDVCVRDGLLYIAQGDDGLGIYSLADPANPLEVRRISRLSSSHAHVEWVYVPSSRWAVCHARRNSGRWYFLDLDKEDPAASSTYVSGMDWIRSLCDDLVGGKWLPYAYTHGFIQWFDLSGDTPVCYDTADTISTLAKSKRKNYINMGACCPLPDDRILVADGTFFLLNPETDLGMNTNGWPTFKYENALNSPGRLPTWDGGTHVGVTSTQGRTIQMADFTVLDKPVLEWYESAVGCPENGVFAPDGRFLVPCGYQGLLVEKREGDVFIPSCDATDAEGYDLTNRLVTVSGLTEGDTVVLTLSALDGSSTTMATATADENGVAAFDMATAPGHTYRYSIERDGEALCMGGFYAGGWNAAGSWFRAAPDGLGGSSETNGAWTSPPAATNATRYVLDGPAVFELTPAARAAGEDALVRVETEIEYTLLTEVPDFIGALSDLDAIVALAATTNWVAGGPSVWSAYIGGAWTPLSGDIAPAEGATYIVRLEGDFSLASPRVRFAASADGGTTFVPLWNAATGAEWLVPSDATKRALSQVATAGMGSIGAIRGALSNAWVAETGGVCYASLAEALRAAGPGGSVALLANATAPSSLTVGRTIDKNGHVLMIINDFCGTLLLMQ